MAWKQSEIKKKFFSDGEICGNILILKTTQFGMTKTARIYRVKRMCCGAIKQMAHNRIQLALRNDSGLCFRCEGARKKKDAAKRKARPKRSDPRDKEERELYGFIARGHRMWVSPK